MLSKSIPFYQIELNSALMTKDIYEDQPLLNAPSSNISQATNISSKYATNNRCKSDNTELSVLRIWLSYPNPFLIQNEIFNICGIKSGSKMSKIKKILLKSEFIIDHKIQIQKAQALVWEPTQKAFDEIGIPKPKYHSKGGYLHQFLAYRISELAGEKGYNVEIESLLSNNKAVDIIMRKENQVIFVEIAISQPFEKEISNILKDLESNALPNKIILAVQNSKMRSKLDNLISQNTQLDQYRKIIKTELAGNLISQNKGV